jgi:hypothetical protein
MANDATFGGHTFNSDVGFAIDFSDDKQAFTVSFSGLVAIINVKGAAPIVTRSFSFSLPLSGAESGDVIPFFVGGFAFTEAGANGHLLFSVNEQTLLVDFPENSNDSFLRQLNYTVGTASELRITIFILADRDSKSDAAANLTVSSIDTDINKHAAQPTA